MGGEGRGTSNDDTLMAYDRLPWGTWDVHILLKSIFKSKSNYCQEGTTICPHVSLTFRSKLNFLEYGKRDHEKLTHKCKNVDNGFSDHGVIAGLD